MAKKLNKKVAYSIIVILGIGFIAATLFGFRWLKERNPEYCLNKARQAFKDSDFINADRYYGRAYAYNNMDQEKIDILFEMAQMHLTNAPEHEPNWRKAVACWNTVLNVKPQHLEARRKIMDYFYQVADGGGQAYWKMVDEHATKLLDIFKQTQQQPEPLVLMAKARACLEIARLGSETNRDELIETSLQTLEELKKLTPEDVKIYEYITDATLMKGELDQAKGIQDARVIARKTAQTVLEEALNNVSDKGAVTAYQMGMELNQAQQDPNTIPALRKKMEELVKTYPKSDLLYSILSASYELHTDMDRRQELDMAVRYTEKAQELAGGQQVRYALRNASLLRRMGQLYKEKEFTERALKISQEALTFPDSIVVAGPKEGIARQNRYELQSFIARCQIEQAIDALQKKDEPAAKQYYDQASKAVDEITQLVGGSTTLIARQWQGMLSLAKGDEKEAYRLLYKVYQEAKAMDKPGELSTVDSYLCYLLSRLAGAQRSLGMQREFLEKAISNRNSITMEKPEAILDYANIMLSLRAGAYAGPVLDTYIRTYGETDEVNLMRAQADILTGEFEAAEKRLNQIKTDDTRITLLRLQSANSQLNLLTSKQAIGAEPLTPDEQKKLSQLQDLQVLLLSELVNKNPSEVNPEIFITACRQEIAKGNLQQAQKLVSSFAAAQPDNIGVQMLKLEMAEPDPATISPSRRQELSETVFMQIKDPVQKSSILGQHYRSLGKPEQAREHFEKAYAQAPENLEIAGNYFGFLLDQKDVKKAEDVFTKIRTKNPDGYEGNLYAAQLEMAKENYTAAFRRLDECDVIRPGSAATAIVKSQIYMIEKNYNAAVENARTALQTDLRNPIAARLLASALYERNRNLSGPASQDQTMELERAIGIALFLNPGDWQLQSVYTEITQEKDPQRALAVRQALLKSTPNINNALMLGNMAMRMAQTETDPVKMNGLREIAQDAYHQAYQMEPDNKMVQATYAEYLRITQQQQKALDIFGKNEDTLWRFYLSDAQYPQAAEILEKLLLAQKGNVEMLQGLVTAYEGMGQREKIQDPLDQLAQQTLTVEQEIWLIQKCLDTGRQEQAQKRLASFQERYPADQRGDLLMSWLNMYQGKTEKALELIQKYLEKNPGSDSGWRVKGRIHRMMNQPQQAIDALQRSKSISTTPEIRIELATIYKQTNQMEAAIGELVGGLDDPQVPPQMLEMLESLYTSQGMGNELVKFYQKMIVKFPKSSFWYTRTGTFLLGQKLYGDAIKLLENAWTLTRNTPSEAATLNAYLKALIEAQQMEKALTLAAEYTNTPLAPVAYCITATIQARQGQKDKAIESFSKAIEKCSGNSSMLMGTLTVMNQVMGPEYMETWCNQKLAADPKSIPVHIILQDIEERRGSYNKALEHLAVCLEQTPQESPDWLVFTNQKATHLIALYLKTADSNYLNQAAEQLESILKLQPNNSEVLNNLAYLLVDNNVQLDKAVEYSRRAYLASPGNAVFLDTHAYALCKRGQFADAERYLRQSIQMSEQNNTTPEWDVYKHLGMALEGQKKNEEALAAYEKSLELGKNNIAEKEKASLEKTIQNLKP